MSEANEQLQQIEEHISNVRNLFIHLFNRMVTGTRENVGVNISIAQLKALSAFHEDRPYTMSELSRNALVKMPSMTEMVDRLETAGILERVRDDRDRRVVHVRLTEKGKELHYGFLERRRAELDDVFKDLDASDRGELVRALATVSRILTKIAPQE